VSKDKPYNEETCFDALLFNEYFGSGLTSIVFQEIREARGLAYMAFAQYETPTYPERSFYLNGVLSTQPDKLKTATDALMSILNEMPRSSVQFENSKKNLLKQIETQRNTDMGIFYIYQWSRKMGVRQDHEEAQYNRVKAMSMDDLQAFFDKHIKGKKYAILVLGNKSAIDMNVLRKIGPVTELTMEEIYNY